MSTTNIDIEEARKHIEAGATPELIQYVNSVPKIKRFRQTLKDSSVLYGALAIPSTMMMALSGANDELEYLFEGNTNWLRLIQGGVALANVTMTAGLSLWGRYQTYKDLSDLQAGVDPQTIINRASYQDKGKISKAAGWTMHNAHNINAYVSMPLCAIMVASGILSGRWGEAATGAMISYSYIVRARKEKFGTEAEQKNSKLQKLWNKALEYEKLAYCAYEIDHAKRSAQKIWYKTKETQTIKSTSNRIKQATSSLEKAWDCAHENPQIAYMSHQSAQAKSCLGDLWQTAKQKPLVASSLIQVGRIGPVLGNAIYEMDWYQTAQHTLGLAMFYFLSNTSKEGIGRYGGSIVNREHGTEISKILLEGSWHKKNPKPATPTPEPEQP